ncbi:MAG: TPM domain-containing protein [bacterium]
MKKIIIVVSMMLLLVGNVVNGQTPVPEQPIPIRLVNDFAGVLTQPQVDGLESRLRAIETSTSIQFAVVTIKTLDGSDVDDFTTALFKKWGVGHKNNAGVVFLVAIDDHKYCVRTGYGIEGDLPDISCHQIAEDYLVPNFRQGDYYKGIDATVKKLLETAGVMPWQDREKARALLAEAKKREDEASAKWWRAFWAGFWNVIGILFIIGLIGFVIYKAMKANTAKKERMALLGSINKSIADCDGLLMNIKSHNADVQKGTLPKWVKTKASELCHDAETLYDDVQRTNAEALKLAREKTCSNESQSNMLFMTYEQLKTKLKTNQAEITTKLASQVAAEEKSKKAAIDSCNEEVKKIYARCIALENQGYKLSEFKQREVSLEKEFKDALNNEEELGETLDNVVEDVVKKLVQLLEDVNAFVAAKAWVEANIKQVRADFQKIQNGDSDTAVANALIELKQYPETAWFSVNADLHTLNSKKPQKAILLEGVVTKNSMYQQKFIVAKADLQSIQKFIKDMNSVYATILGLQDKLIAARKDYSLKDAETQKLVYKIQQLIVNKDVSKETRASFATLLIRVSNADGLLKSPTNQDWISQLTNLVSIYAKLEAVETAAQNEIDAAEEERQRKKRAAEQAEAQRLQRIADDAAALASQNTYTSSISSTPDTSFSFGGGDTGGGGASGSW